MKVRDGKVSRKNRTELSNHYMQLQQDELVIDRQRPGPGHKHYLTIADVKRFIAILPDWDSLSVGLDAVVLAEASDCMGWCCPGVVAVCAWERELVGVWDTKFVDEHSLILDKLGVRYEKVRCDSQISHCYFDEASIKGFQLMHILLHELGHHHDRMTSHRQETIGRGEPYAEAYALEYAERLWDDYFKEFNW